MGLVRMEAELRLKWQRLRHKRHHFVRTSCTNSRILDIFRRTTVKTVVSGAEVLRFCPYFCASYKGFPYGPCAGGSGTTVEMVAPDTQMLRFCP